MHVKKENFFDPGHRTCTNHIFKQIFLMKFAFLKNIIDELGLKTLFSVFLLGSVLSDFPTNNVSLNNNGLLLFEQNDILNK